MKPAGRLRGWSVHLLTASGVLAAFQATAEICAPGTDPRRVFLWLGLAVIIDSADGPLARRWRVKQSVPHIDGRTIKVSGLVRWAREGSVQLLGTGRIGMGLKFIDPPQELLDLVASG